MRQLVLSFIMGLMALQLSAQDTLQTSRGTIEGQEIEVDVGPRKYYDPKVASRRSAIIPGWGQIYNDSWWKVPILYAGLGVCVYYIDYNHK